MTNPGPRVLFISPQPFFQWRGSPIRVSFNLLALSELGYSVDLLTLPFGENRAIPGVRVIRVANSFGLKDIPIGPSAGKVVFDFRLWRRARQLIREEPYQVIHAVEDAGLIAVSLARLSRARLIFEKHSDPGSYRKGRLRNLVMGAYGRAEAYAIRHADAVIATGPGLAAQARAAAPDKPVYHIFDIPSSLADPDPDRVETLRCSLRRQANEVLITYVGSFAVYQGIELLFDSIPGLVRRHPGARFLIIGGTPAEIALRRERLRAEGAEPAVTFLGKLPPDRLPNYLAASDILLSPRVAGTNTPLKLLDYLKAGRCILATDNAANRQILNEESAYFVPPDPASFVAGLSALVQDPARRRRLASRGRDLIRQTYNFSEFKRRLQKVYERLPARPGRRDDRPGGLGRRN